jgi:hypothetical protein
VQIVEDEVQIDGNVLEEDEPALSDLSDEDSSPDELEAEQLERESYSFLK